MNWSHLNDKFEWYSSMTEFNILKQLVENSVCSCVVWNPYHTTTNVNVYSWIYKCSIRSWSGVSSVVCFHVAYDSQW